MFIHTITRFAALAATVAGTTLLGLAPPAAAARPGVSNYAQCFPHNQTVAQDMEAYRSSPSEYVMLQGALVRAGTNTTHYSQWALGQGTTAHAAIAWRTVPRGQYNVYYRWAVWNAGGRRYVVSGWVQVVGGSLVTNGSPSYQGSPIFIGGSTGQCLI